MGRDIEFSKSGRKKTIKSNNLLGLTTNATVCVVYIVFRARLQRIRDQRSSDYNGIIPGKYHPIIVFVFIFIPANVRECSRWIFQNTEHGCSYVRGLVESKTRS